MVGVRARRVVISVDWPAAGMRDELGQSLGGHRPGQVKTLHAAASQVVVHAEGTADGGWEVSVRDDGRGFSPPDPAEGGLGWGQLRLSVVDPLARRGIVVRVQSEPGEGTAVILRTTGSSWVDRDTPARNPVPAGPPG